MSLKFSTLSGFAAVMFVASVAQAGVIVSPDSGWSTSTPAVGWPANYAVTTSTAPDAFSDPRGAGNGRNIFQTFQVGTTFTLDKIFVPYARDPANTNGGNILLRIFSVEDVNADRSVYNVTPSATFAGTGLLLSAVASLPTGGAGYVGAPATTGVLEFDLTGTDEIVIPATTGTAGYAFQIYTQGISGHPFVARYTDSGQNSLYSGGRYYEWNPGANAWYNSNNAAGDRDLAFRMSPVPEPNAMVLLGIGMVGLGGIFRRSRK